MYNFTFSASKYNLLDRKSMLEYRNGMRADACDVSAVLRAHTKDVQIQMQNTKKVSPAFQLIKGMIRFFYPKMKITGLENLPDEPCVIVSNHAQMNGPIACELYFPGKRCIWCAGEMMHLKEVPAYAYRDFWSQKSRATRWFYRLASYVIAPLSVLIFNNAATIPVYKDHRMLTTFRESVARIQEGASIIIFPEHDETCNNIIYEFSDGFISLARMVYRKNGQQLRFVPMYIAPELKQMCLGAPIVFKPDVPFEEEKKRICAELMNSITQMACSLPRHTVVPYRNISRRRYPCNIPNEVNRK